MWNETKERWKKRSWIRRYLCLVLIAVLVTTQCTQSWGITQVIAQTSCPDHIQHNDECGYAEAVAASACMHICSEECQERVLVCDKTEHTHDESCQFAAEGEEQTSEGSECDQHTHEDACYETVENCLHVQGKHDTECGYAEAKDASECKHTCEKCEVASNLSLTDTVFDKNPESADHKDIVATFDKGADELTAILIDDVFGEESIAYDLSDDDSSDDIATVTLSTETLAELEEGDHTLFFAMDSGTTLVSNLEVTNSQQVEEGESDENVEGCEHSEDKTTCLECNPTEVQENIEKCEHSEDKTTCLECNPAEEVNTEEEQDPAEELNTEEEQDPATDLDPASAVFSKNMESTYYRDIEVTLNNGANAFLKIERDHTTEIETEEGTETETTRMEVACDPSENGETVTLKKETLAELEEGVHTLYFMMEGDMEKTFRLIVTDLQQVEEGDLVAITEETFPDEGFREYVSDEYDIDGDGFLSFIERAIVTKINTGETAHPFKNLKGIEYFTELERLVCRLGKLESVDLSQNTKLTFLNLRNNNLKELNITGLDKLTYLHVGYNQELRGLNGTEVLDVSGFEYLETLYGNSTSLTEVDVSGCKSLKRVSFNNVRALEKTDFSDCEVLEHLDVGYCNLESLVLRNCTNLVDLYCNNNYLSSLDLSACDKLETLEAQYNELESLIWNDCTNLNYLDCRNNHLSSLDLSGCVNLETFLGTGQTLSRLMMASEGEKWVDATNTEFTPGVTKFYSDTTWSDEAALTNLTVDTNTKLLTAEELESRTDPVYFQSKMTAGPADNPLVCDLSGSFHYAKSGELIAETCYMDVNTATGLSEDVNLAEYFDISIDGKAVDALECTIECDEAVLGAIQEGTIGTYLVIIKYNELEINATLEVGVEIFNTMNFDDPLFQSYISNKHDTKRDGFLTSTELKAPKSMSVEGTENAYKYTSLKGIEYFTELTSLYCRFGYLESLDVSKNTKLTYLNARNNNITTEGLKLSESSKGLLKELHIGNNQLTSLDVSDFTVLERLSCFNNQLTELNVSGCEALYELNVHTNHLTNINISGCVALKAFRGELQTLPNLYMYQNGTKWVDSTNTEFVPGITTFYSDYNGETWEDSSKLANLTVDAETKLLTAETLDPITEPIYFKTDLVAENEYICELSGSFQYSMMSMTAETCYMDVNIAAGIQNKDELAKYFDITLNGTDIANPQSFTVECADEDFAAIREKTIGTYPVTIKYGVLEVNADLVVGVEIANTANFPDEEFQKFVSGYDTGDDQQGFLTFTELGKVRAIDTGNEPHSFTNIKGIEYFTELTTLQIRFGSLESVDVSKNTKLTTLNIRNNSLKELNISGCDKLTYLNVGNNPLLGSLKGTEILDVNGFDKLQTLYAYNTSMTKINASGCKALEKLACYSSNLNEVDITGCEGLTSIRVANNELESLDLSSCQNLVSLECSNNHLSSLDVSACGLLETFSGDNQTLSRLRMTSQEGKWVDATSTEFTPGITKFYSDTTWSDEAVLTNFTVDPDTKLLAAEELESRTAPVYFQSQLTAGPAESPVICDLNGSFCYSLPGELVAETCYMDINTVKRVKKISDLARYFELSIDGETVDAGAFTFECDDEDFKAIQEGTIGTYSITIKNSTHEVSATLEVGVSINATNFPDPQFQIFVATNCDTNKDGFMTKTELEATKQLTIAYNAALEGDAESAMGYTSLKGIEYFTELTSLTCQFGMLESLDVSKNTKLTYLNVRDNDLKELNISGCTALETLWCNGNHLTNVDISQCHALSDFQGGDQTLSDLAMLHNGTKWVDATNTEFLPEVTTFYSDYSDAIWSEIFKMSNLTVDSETKLLTAEELEARTEPVYFKTDLVADRDEGNDDFTCELSGSFYYTLATMNAETCYMDVNIAAGVENKDDLAKYFDISFNGINLEVDLEYTVECADEHFTAIQQKTVGTYPVTICLGNLTVDTTLEVGVEIDNTTNFPDEAFREFVSGYDTGDDKQGFLTFTELQPVTEIHTGNNTHPFKDLKGIEYFTELERVLVRFGDLESLDVSKNTKLTYLNVRNNNLKELNISGCDKLTYLNIGLNPLLGSLKGTEILEVSGLESLETFHGSHTLLKKMDFSGCTSLSHLEANGGILETLDISGCDALTTLLVKGSELESLDLSSCKNLETLDCSKNHLSSLDVSACAKLETFTGTDQTLSRLRMASEGAQWVDTTNTQFAPRVTKFYSDTTWLDESALTNLTVNPDTKLLTAEELESRTDPVYFQSNLTAGSNITCELSGSFHYALPGELVAETCYMDVNTAKGLKTMNDLAWYFDMSIDGEAVDAGVVTVECGDEQFLAIQEGAIGTYHVTVKNGTHEISATLEVGVSINDISFPDPHFQLDVESLYDVDRDLFLTQTELNAVTRINLNAGENQWIGYTSLKGIEYFTELTYLKCRYTNLESLDVRNNTKLTYLNIRNNNITIEELKISESSKEVLESLYCNDNPLTGSLDLSGFTALKTLWCQNSQLTELNVTGCESLQTLQCYENHLTNVNISGCDSLKDFQGGDQILSNLLMFQNGTKWVDATNTEFAPGITTFYSDYNGETWSEELNLTVDPDTKLLTAEELESRTAPVYFKADLAVDNENENKFTCELSGSFYYIMPETMAAKTSYMDVNIAAGIENKDDLAKYFEISFNGIDAAYDLDYTVECRDVDFTAIREKTVGTYPITIKYGNIAAEAALEVGVSINATHFPDDAFREFVFEHDTGNDMQGFLTVKELDSAKQINSGATANSIKDLQGIEYFTELTTLVVRFSKLESVDLSKNTKLTYLNLRNNNLKELNINGLDKLTYLHVGFNPEFRGLNGTDALDVSGFEDLETLYGHRTSLTKVNASGCKSLKVVNFESASTLKEMDFSDCEVLETLNVGYTNLDSLVLSNCTNLKSLYCRNNRLSSLDLSMCEKLETLEARHNELESLILNNCTNLNYLDCRNNHLSSLDVSGCVNLETFLGTDQTLSRLMMASEGEKWVDATGTEFTPGVTKFYSDTTWSDEAALTNLTVDTNTKLLTAEELESRTDPVYFQSKMTAGHADNPLICDLSGSFYYAKSGELVAEICYMDVNTAADLSEDVNLAEYFDISIDGEAVDAGAVTVECGDEQFLAIQEGTIGTYPVTIKYNTLETNATLEVGVEIFNTTNFLDPLFQSYVSNNCDTKRDGFLTPTELKAVNSITADGGLDSSVGYTSLKGIEYFTELTRLTSRYSYYESVDVSKNTKLTYLNLRDNTIKELKISESSKGVLTELLIGNNQLTSLDVSGFTVLGRLNCGNNQLTKLNVSGCEALQTLNCPGNHLSDVNISGCKSLGTFSGGDQTLSDLVMIQNGTKWVDATNTEFAPDDTKFYSDTTWSDESELKKLGVDKTTKVMTAETLPPITKPIYFQSQLTADNQFVCELSGSFYYTAPEIIGAETCYMDVNIAAGIENKDDLAKYFDITINGMDETYNLDFTIQCSNQIFGAIQEETIGTYPVTIRLGNLKTVATLEVGVKIDNEVNFPDPTFRDFVSGYDTGVDDKEGFLTFTELTGVTEIVLEGESENPGPYVNLQGIKYFSNLATLDCSFNRITDLNVSSNQMLQSLYCQGNNMGTLTLGTNTNLNTLDCSTNGLTELDVSGCENLVTLDCSYNDLPELDVRECEDLVTFKCTDNELEELILSSNRYLETLWCSINNLEELILSNNTELTELLCQSNQLKELDVTELSELNKLYCDENQLTNLSIGGLEKLTSVTASGQEVYDVLPMVYEGTQWINKKMVETDVVRTFSTGITEFHKDDSNGDPLEFSISNEGILTAENVLPIPNQVYFAGNLVNGKNDVVGALTGTFRYEPRYVFAANNAIYNSAEVKGALNEETDLKKLPGLLYPNTDEFIAEATASLENGDFGELQSGTVGSYTYQATLLGNTYTGRKIHVVSADSVVNAAHDAYIHAEDFFIGLSSLTDSLEATVIQKSSAIYKELDVAGNLVQPEGWSDFSVEGLENIKKAAGTYEITIIHNVSQLRIKVNVTVLNDEAAYLVEIPEAVQMKRQAGADTAAAEESVKLHTNVDKILTGEVKVYTDSGFYLYAEPDKKEQLLVSVYTMDANDRSEKYTGGTTPLATLDAQTTEQTFKLISGNVSSLKYKNYTGTMEFTITYGE